MRAFVSCVIFLFFAPGPVAVGGGFVFGRRAPPRIPPPVSNPRKKHSRPARFAPGPPAPPICGGGVQMCQESPPFFCPLCQPRKKLSGAACFRARRPHPPGCRKCVALMSQRYFVFSRPPDRGRPAGEPPRHSPSRRIEPRRLPPRRSAACFRLRKNFSQGAHSARAGAFAGCRGRGRGSVRFFTCFFGGLRRRIRCWTGSKKNRFLCCMQKNPCYNTPTHSVWPPNE